MMNLIENLYIINKDIKVDNTHINFNSERFFGPFITLDNRFNLLDSFKLLQNCDYTEINIPIANFCLNVFIIILLGILALWMDNAINSTRQLGDTGIMHSYAVPEGDGNRKPIIDIAYARVNIPGYTKHHFFYDTRDHTGRNLIQAKRLGLAQYRATGELQGQKTLVMDGVLITGVMVTRASRREFEDKTCDFISVNRASFGRYYFTDMGEPARIDILRGKCWASRRWFTDVNEAGPIAPINTGAMKINRIID